LTTDGEASTGSVETDRTSDGLKVPPIESVTLSMGKDRRMRIVPPYLKSAGSSPIIT
jgi:hypothetical protein